MNATFNPNPHPNAQSRQPKVVTHAKAQLLGIDHQPSRGLMRDAPSRARPPSPP